MIASDPKDCLEFEDQTPLEIETRDEARSQLNDFSKEQRDLAKSAEDIEWALSNFEADLASFEKTIY